MNFLSARVFVPCKPFQDSIVFMGKAGVYPFQELHSRVGFWPCPQTVD
jgi:hypothetical protein